MYINQVLRWHIHTEGRGRGQQSSPSTSNSNLCIIKYSIGTNLLDIYIKFVEMRSSWIVPGVP